MFASGACGAAFAQAAPSQPTATPAANKPKSDNPGDKIICRIEEGDTGSRLNSRTKVCHTKREWDQINKDAADWIDTKGKCPGRR